MLRGLAASAASTVGSLDAGPGDPTDESPNDRQAALAAEERGFDEILDEQVVETLLGQLPERERRIVQLRFREGMSQDRIAEEMGMSQMHVSRLLRRSFETMRSALDETPPD